MAIRTKDAKAEKWARGGSPDHRIGSIAKALISDIDDKAKLETLYKKIVPIVKGTDEAVQRAALVAAASDFSLDSLIALAATPTKAKKKLGKRDMKMLEALPKDEAAQLEALLKKAKGII